MKSNVNLIQEAINKELNNWTNISDKDNETYIGFKNAIIGILELNTYTFTSDDTIKSIKAIIFKDEFTQDAILTFITNVKYNFYSLGGDWSDLVKVMQTINSSLEVDPLLDDQFKGLTNSREVKESDTSLIIFYNLCKSVTTLPPAFLKSVLKPSNSEPTNE